MPAATTTAPAPGPFPVRVGTAIRPAQAGPPEPGTARDGAPPAAPAVPVPAPVPEAAPAPLLRVERGTATAEEIAAVTAVLSARLAAAHAAAEAEDTLTARRAAARWRGHGFAGPRAWTADARDLLAG